MQEIKFGTDGFRGLIAEDFTFSNLKKIGQAIAEYLKKSKPLALKRGVIVGYDRRFLSDKFAEHISAQISGNGIPVFLADKPVPTPAVSYFVRANGLPCGIIITASHNPSNFNGLKIKNEYGASATSATTKAIERLINSQQNTSPKAIAPAKIKKIDIIEPYVKLLRKYLNFNLLKKSRFMVIIDVMHGTGYDIFEKVLKSTKCEVVSIHTEHDPLFGGVNPEPIYENLAELLLKIRNTNCDLAIALDGDADRIGAMCPSGRYISSHYTICLLLLHLIENRKWTGRVIKSINTTTMVDKITEHYKLHLEEVPIGFKNIACEMQKGDVLLGGEESGGIGFKNYMPERDGVLAGLLLLELMAQKKEPILKIIYDLEKRFGHFAYLRKDIKLKSIKKSKKIPHPKSILNKTVFKVKTYDGTKFILEDESWLLIRASGTEPIVRIYAESKNLRFTQKLINFGEQLLCAKT